MAWLTLALMAGTACSACAGAMPDGGAGPDFFAQLGARLAARKEHPGAALPRLEFALLIHAEKYEQAERFYDEHLPGKQRDLPAQFARALLFLSLERPYRPRDTLNFLHKLEQQYPQNPMIYYELAGFLLRMGRIREPWRYMKRALEKDPLCAQAYFRMAQLSTVSVAREDCVAYCTRVLLLEEPGSALSRKAAGVIDETGLYPKHPTAVPWKADLRIADSKLLSRVASHRKKDHLVFRQLYFALLLHSEQYHKAEAFYKQRLAAEMQAAELQVAYARLLGRGDDFAGSMRLLKKLQQQYPRNPLILYEIGVTHLLDDQKQAAGRYFQRALRAQPLLAPAHYRFALLAAEREQPNDCLKHATDVLLIEKPGSSLAQDAGGVIDRCLKRLAGAEDSGHQQGP